MPDQAVPAGAPATFTIEYTVDNTEPGIGSDHAPDTPPTTPYAPSVSREPRTPEPSPVPFVTSPTGETHDTEGVALRFRMMEEVIDHTKPAEVEYSGLCLLAAEEPGNVDDSLAEGCWRKAMEEEMCAIRDNDTWELTELPTGHRAIGLKWVFKIKKDPQGNVIKHKARLVAKGYAQRERASILRRCSRRWRGWRLCACSSRTAAGTFTTWM